MARSRAGAGPVTPAPRPAGRSRRARPAPRSGPAEPGPLAYGIVGLVIAVLGLGLLLYANTRLDAAGDRVETSLVPLATTLDRTADALHDAATTAETFGTTLDRTQEAVSAAATTIIGVRTNLQTLESVLRAVNILGCRRSGRLPTRSAASPTRSRASTRA